jgi:hypothetical protein
VLKLVKPPRYILDSKGFHPLLVPYFHESMIAHDTDFLIKSRGVESKKGVPDIGRFKISGNQIWLENPLLIDHPIKIWDFPLLPVFDNRRVRVMLEVFPFW